MTASTPHTVSLQPEYLATRLIKRRKRRKGLRKVEGGEEEDRKTGRRGIPVAPAIAGRVVVSSFALSCGTISFTKISLKFVRYTIFWSNF